MHRNIGKSKPLNTISFSSSDVPNCEHGCAHFTHCINLHVLENIKQVRHRYV